MKMSSAKMVAILFWPQYVNSPNSSFGVMLFSTNSAVVKED